MVVLIQASYLRENQMVVLDKQLVQDKIKLLCKVSIWFNSGSNGCVTTCITHWHIGGEIGKLDTLQQHLLTACSLQFAWLTVDHNSAVFGQLQPITISELFELKPRKLNSEANSVWNSSIGV